MHFGIGVGIPFVSRRNQFCSSLVNDNPHHPVVEEKSKVQAWIENKWWNWLLRNLTAVINQHITIIWVHCYLKMGKKQKSCRQSELFFCVCFLKIHFAIWLPYLPTERCCQRAVQIFQVTVQAAWILSLRRRKDISLFINFLKNYYLEVVKMFFFWGTELIQTIFAIAQTPSSKEGHTTYLSSQVWH